MFKDWFTIQLPFTKLALCHWCKALWRIPFCEIFLCTVLPVLAFRNVRFDVQFKPKIACFTVKMSSAPGGLRPWPPTGGSSLDPRWEQNPQTPLIGSRSRARHDRGPGPQIFRLDPRLWYIACVLSDFRKAPPCGFVSEVTTLNFYGNRFRMHGVLMRIPTFTWIWCIALTRM